ncbi:MAG: hypothetical protein ACHBN1_23440 [Heteroscytonema crispum UTEX LB 1556]
MILAITVLYFHPNQPVQGCGDSGLADYIDKSEKVIITQEFAGVSKGW